jgi:hypothetical protein
MGAGLLNTSFKDADDIAEAVARPDRDIVKERIATEVQIQREIADGTGSITSIAVQAQRDSGLQARAEAEKKDKKGGIDMTTRLILLNQQIEALDFKIGELESRIDDIEDRIFSPEEQAAFNALPPEDRYAAKDQAMRDKVASGEITQAAYYEWKRLQEELKATKQQKAEVEAEHAELSRDADQTTERELSGDIRSAGEAARTATLSEDQQASLDTATNEAIAAADKTEGLEQRMLTLEDLEQYKRTDEYTARIDEFIENADPEIISQELKDNPDSEISARIGLRNFYEDLSFLDEYKGTDDYQMYVQMAVDDAPESVREALRNEPNLNEELTTALYKPYSDETDAEQRSTSASPKRETDEPSGQSTTDPNPDLAAKPMGLG